MAFTGPQRIRFGIRKKRYTLVAAPLDPITIRKVARLALYE